MVSRNMCTGVPVAWAGLLYENYRTVVRVVAERATTTSETGGVRMCAPNTLSLGNWIARSKRPLSRRAETFAPRPPQQPARTRQCMSAPMGVPQTMSQQSGRMIGSTTRRRRRPPPLAHEFVRGGATTSRRTRPPPGLTRAHQTNRFARAANKQTIWLHLHL